MAARKVKVTYRDGREEVIKVYPDAQVMTEEFLDGFKSERMVAATYHLGWAALQTSGKVFDPFDVWIKTVEDVEDVETDADPTPPAPSADTSSD
jgi:hypothetical protein